MARSHVSSAANHSSGGRTAMNDLPEECLREIFTRIGSPSLPLPLPPPSSKNHHPALSDDEDNVRHPLQCIFLCKQWKSATVGAITSLTFSQGMTIKEHSDSLTLSLAQFYSLTTLSFLNCTIMLSSPNTSLSFFERLAASTPRLENLFLHDIQTESTNENRPLTITASLASALPKWKSLKNLTFGKELKLKEEDGPSLLPLFDSLSLMPSLEDLHLSARIINGLSLEIAAKKLHNISSLLKLQLSTSDHIPPSMAALRALNSLILVDFTHSHLPENLGLSTNLTSLAVNRANQLLGLPTSLGSLRGLESLRISSCHGVSELPESVGELSRLTSLHISDCPLVSLPETLGGLRSLRKLRLIECCFLRRLPEAVCQLDSLESLHLASCSAITALPRDIRQLAKSLRALKLTKCLSLQALPDSVCDLGKLVELEMDVCVSLRRLPSGFGRLLSLKRLSLMDCRMLESLFSGEIEVLKSLVYLDISGCSEANLPRSLAALTNLEILRMDKVGSTSDPRQTFPHGFSCLGRLRELSIDAGGPQQWLPPGLSRLSKLEVLSVRGYLTKGRATPSGVLQFLQQRWLSGLPEPSLLGGVGDLKGLRHLKLVHCTEHLTEDLLKISTLRKLSWYTTSEVRRLPANKGIVDALREKGCGTFHW